MLKKYFEELFVKAIQQEFGITNADIIVDYAVSESFGDYYSNAGMVLAKTLKQNPMEIARKIVYRVEYLLTESSVGNNFIQSVDTINVTAPGFINITLTDEWVNMILMDDNTKHEYYEAYKNLVKMTYVLEYTDPNPFKVFHIGHLMTNCIGESLSRIFEFSGAKVKRLNYQGDVGMHVAKSVWGLIKLLEEENLTLENLGKKSLKEIVTFMGKAYAFGSAQYSDEAVSKEINDINVYCYVAAQEIMQQEHNVLLIIDFRSKIESFDDKLFAKIRSVYTKGREWSLDYFEDLYVRLGTKFDRYYFESEMGEKGVQIVEDGLEKGIFDKENGAVIFRGEKYDLHTRVFLNSKGLPVYESKDLALALKKDEEFHFDKSYVVTGNEVNEYFKVVLKALSLFNADLSEKYFHLGHGMMQLSTGKMSSRTGKVVGGEDLINQTRELVQQKMTENNVDLELVSSVSDKIAISSIKYLVLRSSIGNNISYDPEKVIDFQGDSGPYLQYTYARIKSILAKVGDFEKNTTPVSLENPIERRLAISVLKFPEIVYLAANQTSPHLIAGYLRELCQHFNSFYSACHIMSESDSNIKAFRLVLLTNVAQVIKDGLWLLGIETVEKM